MKCTIVTDLSEYVFGDLMFLHVYSSNSETGIIVGCFTSKTSYSFIVSVVLVPSQQNVEHTRIKRRGAHILFY